MNALNLAEIGLLKALQGLIGCAPLDRLFGILTTLGEGGALWIALALVLLIIPRTRHIGCSMVLAMALCYLGGNLVLKNLIARPRPFQVDPSIRLVIPPPREYSFPSGHTMNGFAAASALWHERRRAGALALALAALIAFTRLYFCVHYPTDVLGGIVIGCASGRLFSRIVNAFAERRAAHV